MTSAWCPLALGIYFGARMTNGYCQQLLALVWAACGAAKGDPPLLGGSKDHKWLVHTGCRRSFWSENDKRLVPTGYRHSLWSEDGERLVPRLLTLVRAGSAAAKGCPLPPPREEMITSVYCTTAVSIRLGARMTRGWCPPAVGIRSGTRIMSGWCPRLLAIVRADCAAAPVGARITSS